MGQEKIELSDEVIQYLKDLVDILFEKEYFGFEQSAHDYVDKIIDAISLRLSNNESKKSPDSLTKYGEFYITYNPNKHTTWYILFDKYPQKIVVTYIFNNHHPMSQFMI